MAAGAKFRLWALGKLGSLFPTVLISPAFILPVCFPELLI